MQKKLERCVKEFNDDEQSTIYYEAVRKTFNDYPKNVKKLDIVLKVAVLNELYRTNIMATYKLANHIHKLATKENFDNLLKKGDLDAVKKIRKGHGICRKNKKDDIDFYSFATKYCHFSNPKCYPIYDQYVEKAIIDLQKNNNAQFKKQEDLRDQLDFRNIIDRIIRQYGFNDYQQIDRALWVYGKQITNEW